MPDPTPQNNTTRPEQALSHSDLLAYYHKTAPFLRRLKYPRYDEYETNDYICESSDCGDAIDALDNIEANTKDIHE